jgi:hypothetical protein
MNHDMIAAGHPRLNFEFAGYLAQLPAHWNESVRKRDAQFFARAWAIGQVVSAEAAIELLHYRAAQPAWPELAEYACYACHHDLVGPKNNWRQQEGSKGTLPWGSWYFAAIPAIDPEAAPALTSFAELLSRRPAGPVVIEQSQAAKAILKGAIEKAKLPNADMRSRVARDLQPAAERDWDGAAQLYLALSALSPDADRANLVKFGSELLRPRDFSAKREQYLKELNELLRLAGAAPP